METFILKLVGIICITSLAMLIIISRRNDVEISAILITTIFEIIGLIIIYLPMESIFAIIGKI